MMQDQRRQFLLVFFVVDRGVLDNIYIQFDVRVAR